MGIEREKATALDNIGGIYNDQGNYSQSMEYHQQALAIRREIGDRSGELTSVGNIGFIYHVQGRYREAIEFYQKSLVSIEILTTLNNRQPTII
ncbi:tetratricopeptide repeat protein [Capilliphycus salinus ALCB114379]|uniref:tetratricopeptide repeat protein n=1 Tax=Capilliphycus salinus TaxID=2768948 RepID=UPI0039A782FE